MNTILRSRRSPVIAVRGFALAELVLVVCCLAVVLAPFVVYLSRVGELQHESAGQGRAQAWGGVQGGAVGRGVDPVSSSVLRGEHPLSSGRRSPEVSRGEALWSREEGQPMLVPLRGGGPAVRLVGPATGAGFEVSAGLVEQAAGPQTEAGQGSIMAPPQAQPSIGTVLGVGAFSSGRASFRLQSPEGGVVILELTRPVMVRRASGQLDFQLSVAEVADGMGGEAWVEFDGASRMHAESFALPDGRLAWLVKEAGGVHVYLPSERVSLSYVLDLGAPQLRLGTSVYGPGAVVPVDMVQVSQVRKAELNVAVEWSAQVQALFGNAMPARPIPPVQVEFLGGSARGGSGLEALLFGEEVLVRWLGSNTLRARGELPAGCVANAATWILERRALRLPQPIRVAGASVGGDAESPGVVTFRVDELPGLGFVGRLSARGGAVLSPGGSLGLEVWP